MRGSERSPREGGRRGPDGRVAIEIPGPGMESVWDYPRPPAVQPVSRRVRVRFGGVTVADTRRALRVIETASPPTYYIPPADVRLDLLDAYPGTTRCEWKGEARYWSLRVGVRLASRAAWSYPRPAEGFESIATYLAFFAQRVDECLLDDERVRPQPGAFYGGWITSDLTGPFKGERGTEGW